jgi:hypothetical protein
LREARNSDAVLDRRLGAFFAIDQDPQAVALVRQELGTYGVEAVEGSVRGVLTGKVAYRDIDLAYAAGLYDYLGQPLAVQLTRRLFDMLAPGGELLIPNFNPSLRDIAYLEAFMDWRLIYRDDEMLLDLASAIPVPDVASVRVYRERHGNISFLEIRRQ